MDRFEYADSRLGPGEAVLLRHKGVNLYDGNTKTSFTHGEIVLTTHRLLWGHPGDIARGLTCLSLSLHYIVFTEEEFSTVFGFTKSQKIILHLSQAMKGKNLGPVASSLNNYIKLSFKEGLPEEFVSTLKNAIQAKKWEFTVTSPLSSALPTGNKHKEIKLRTGIVGIERGIQEKQKATDESITAAFQDLSKLMSMAKDMVHLSKSISAKIREKQGDITEDETVRFKSYLLSLGIDDPVTRDGFRNESQFHKSLACQVAEFFEEPITEVGGIMSLTDAYCRINRARGLELLSPEDFLNACQMLERLSLSVRLRVFDSGVKVLQLASHNDKAIITSTAESVKSMGSLTSEQLAQELGISVLLAKERLLTTEKSGAICRDDNIEGLRFYPNLFLEREES